MEKVSWVLQNNMGRSMDSSLDQLIECFERRSIRWTHCPYIPFDGSAYDEIPVEGITIFYGSIHFIQRANSMALWKPGALYDPERFNFKALRGGFATELLNYDSELLTISALCSQKLEPTEKWFLRPVEDNKSFPGGLYDASEIGNWEKLLSDSKRLRSDTVIQKARPQKLIREMRSFVVNGAVSTSSYYGYGWQQKEPLPDDVAYATSMAKLYQPAALYTLDTALLENGQRKVIETNCFHSSGLYNIDVDKLVTDVHTFLQEKYG